MSTVLYHIKVFMNMIAFAIASHNMRKIMDQLPIRQCQARGKRGKKVARPAKTGKTGSFMVRRK